MNLKIFPKCMIAMWQNQQWWNVGLRQPDTLTNFHQMACVEKVTQTMSKLATLVTWFQPHFMHCK